MSEENVELVRTALDAWDRDDLEGFLALLDPSVEWHGAIERAFAGVTATYSGHDGVRELWDEYRSEVFGSLTARVDELRDLGDSVLLLGTLDVRDRSSGLDLGNELGMVITVRDGRIVSSEDFLAHAEAIEAAGLTE